MAQRRNSAQPAEDIGGENIETVETAVAMAAAPTPVPAIQWPVDDDSSLAELLAEHGFAGKVTARLIELASAPTHAKRPVDRLAIALGAQFNFFALEEAWQQPILLCGLPGAGISTLAAKLAARFDDSEVLVIAAGAHDAEKTALLAENLEALDLPLTRAADAAALRRVVSEAAGRKIIVDVAARSPFDRAQVKEFIAASGAAGMLVISAESVIADTTSVAKAASEIGVARMIVTGLDAGRYLGAALSAADATKLALVSASVTPHFGFGLRAFTPENLARRLMSGGHPERWRVAPI
jgi:signal recognition particle GTPase